MINEQLYINNISVPLNGAVGAALTKSIQDITEPNKRKTTFSKTITLPDSKTLREVFENFQEFNITTGTFNPLNKSNVRYIVGGELVLEGYLQLKKATRIDEEFFKFEVVLFGNLGNFFEEIKDAKLEDLDLSIYNHILNREVQSESWDSQIIKSGVFVPFNKGEGYVYALVDYGLSTDATTFPVAQIGTSIYARQYMVSIFEEAGWTWTSSFLDSDLFKSLIIPSSPETFALTSSELANRSFTANTPELTSTGTTTSGNIPNLTLSTRDVIINTVELSDAGGNYDPATGKYTAVNAGIYTFEATVHINATFTPSTGANVICISDVNGYLMLHKTDVSEGVTVQVAASPFWITYDDAGVYSSGARTTTVNATYPDNDYLEEKRWSAIPSVYPSTPAAVPREKSVPDEYNVIVTGVALDVGDTIEFSWKAGMYSPPSTAASPVMFADSGGTLYSGTCTLDFPVGSFYAKADNTYTYVGNSLPINKVIPKNIKQVDFIMSFVKMFNLFIEADPDNDRNLIIEPRDDYYAQDVINIHEKIDRSKDFDTYPVTDLNALKYIYTYKPDKDYFNELYTSRYDRVYGDAEIDVTHDFGTNIDKTEIIFSPTPSVSLPFSDRVLPTIQQRDDAGLPVSTESNIRLLYYGGLKDCTDVWKHVGYYGPPSLGLVAVDNYTQYPYAGHFDDPYNPTLDINFSLVKEVFYYSSPENPITVTNNNLFNAYHINMLRAYTDSDTRIVECYVNMNQVDWVEWDFTKLYWFGVGGNYAYHRLYKVFDYNPSNAETTKVQFLKLADVELFSASTDVADGAPSGIIPDGSGGSVDTGETAPSLPSPIGADGTIGEGRSASTMGETNYIDPTAKNVEILGDNNEVRGGVNGVNIINGDNNIIDAGVRNATLINTDGVTVTADNQVWVGGNLISGGEVIKAINVSFTAQPDVNTYEITNNGANITVTLDETLYNTDKTWNFKKMDAGYTITLTPSSGTIDGATTQTIRTQYDNVKLKFDGTNFIII